MDRLTLPALLSKPEAISLSSDRRIRYPLPVRQRGIALIGVLFGLTVLALFAAGLVRDTRTELLLTRNFLTTAHAEAAADGAVYRAIADITASTDRSTGVAFAVESVTIDGDAGPMRITTAIEDEGGKLDLNHAHPAHMLQLLLQLDVVEAEALSDAMIDFRDGDDNRRGNGAEWPDYRAAGLPYVAHNRPFKSVDELRLVLGMTEDIFQRLLPYITIYSRRRGVDPNHAPEAVLRSVPGLDDGAVDAILDQRSTQQGLPAFGALGLYFSRSNHRVFTIRSEARAADGGRFVRHAVIELTGRRGGYRAHVWRTGHGRSNEEAE